MTDETPLSLWRKRENLTPTQAAERLGVTLPMWSRWERNKRDVPAVRVLDIEEKTGVSRHDLRPDVFGTPEASAA